MPVEHREQAADVVRGDEPLDRGFRRVGGGRHRRVVLQRRGGGHGGEQREHVERLGHVLGEPCLDGTIARAELCAPGDGDDGNRRRALDGPKRVEEVEAISVRKAHVGEDDIRQALGKGELCGGERVRGPHRRALAFEKDLNELAIVLVVLYHENDRVLKALRRQAPTVAPPLVPTPHLALVALATPAPCLPFAARPR